MSDEQKDDDKQDGWRLPFLERMPGLTDDIAVGAGNCDGPAAGRLPAAALTKKQCERVKRRTNQYPRLGGDVDWRPGRPPRGRLRPRDSASRGAMTPEIVLELSCGFLGSDRLPDIFPTQDSLH